MLESVDQREARTAATFRGHLMSAFAVLEPKRTMNAACYYCDAEMVVNSRPRPNEINIAGKAVALNCKG